MHDAGRVCGTAAETIALETFFGVALIYDDILLKHLFL